MVFPMAAKRLTEADYQGLNAEFANLDRVIGQEVIRRMEQFAESLSLQAGTSSQHTGPGLAAPPHQVRGQP